MFEDDEKLIEFVPKYPYTLPQDWAEPDNPTVFEISATLDTLKKCMQIKLKISIKEG